MTNNVLSLADYRKCTDSCFLVQVRLFDALSEGSDNSTNVTRFTDPLAEQAAHEQDVSETTPLAGLQVISPIVVTDLAYLIYLLQDCQYSEESTALMQFHLNGLTDQVGLIKYRWSSSTDKASLMQY